MICGAAVSCLGQQLSEMAEAAFQLQGAKRTQQIDQPMGREGMNGWNAILNCISNTTWKMNGWKTLMEVWFR